MTIAIAVAALAVSLSTFLTSRWRDRRDLFLRIHERLASVDQQRGRLMIHRMKSRGTRVTDLSEDEYEAINNALSVLNVACFYYLRRYISRKDMLRTWSVSILRAFDAAQPFLNYRNSLTGTRTWPELQTFTADAERYLQRHGTNAQLTHERSADESIDVSTDVDTGA